MDIYRAVPRSEYEAGQPVFRSEGRRLPGNVSYLVDNLWEFARPDGLPSRRHAVYASPTPALALQNASSGGLAREDYISCRLEFTHQPALFQLAVTDARYHPDIGRLQKLVNLELRDRAHDRAADKLALAALFLPGVTRDELLAAMEDCPLLNGVVQRAAAAVTLWDSQASPPSPDGELFFELSHDNAFTLHPV